MHTQFSGEPLLVFIWRQGLPSASLLITYFYFRYVSPLNYTARQGRISAPTTRTWTRNPVEGSGIGLTENIHAIPHGNNIAPAHVDEEIQITFEKHRIADGSHYYTTNGHHYKSQFGKIPVLFRVLRNETLPENTNTLYTSGNGRIVQLVVNNGDKEGHPGISLSIEYMKVPDGFFLINRKYPDIFNSSTFAWTQFLDSWAWKHW